MRDRPGGRHGVLYISPNPIGSALVRSQVLPYIRGLAERGYEMHLLTFETPESIRRALVPDAVTWHPVRRHRGRHLVAKVLDVASGIATALRVTRSARIGLVHARSYLPAAVAWAASRARGIPYLFDMRGFLGEEYVEGEAWTRGDMRYRVLRAAERILLRDAREIVVLTHAAERRLRGEERYRRLVTGREVSVVPCAVDLERFRPSFERATPPVLVYSGSLGMWYLLEEMLGVYSHARRIRPDLRLLVLNRDEAPVVSAAVARLGLADAPIEVRGADFAEMPGLLSCASVGIALIRPVSSKAGSSPIKVAEYLACGLPVVVNDGIGDTAELVDRYGAGHVMHGFSRSELSAAGREVVRLLDDDGARRAARQLAEEVLGLEGAIQTYAAAYARMLAR